MILGGADVSFLSFLEGVQPDSGLICLVSLLNSYSNSLLLSLLEGRKGGREEGRKV